MVRGISGQGREAEIRFRNATGASRSRRPADGDALLSGHNVEIKKASTNTLNQVRPVKYVPLVVLDTRTDDWFVVPPDQVVRLAAKKKRGQHTENPFESVTLSVADIRGQYLVSEDQLRTATMAAIEHGERASELRDLMAEIRQRSSDLAEWSRDRVRELL
jgi:hypothetical protein